MNRQAEDCPVRFSQGDMPYTTADITRISWTRHRPRHRVHSSCRHSSIAGAAPLQELFEQPVALVLRQGSGRDITGRQELLELVAPRVHRLVTRLLEPFVG